MVRSLSRPIVHVQRSPTILARNSRKVLLRQSFGTSAMVRRKIPQNRGISTSLGFDESNERRRRISRLCCVPATNITEIFIEIRVGNLFSPEPLDVPSNYAVKYRIVVTMTQNQIMSMRRKFRFNIVMGFIGSCYTRKNRRKVR